MPTALITGASGQDGRLLSEHLLSLSYTVVGTGRGGSPFEKGRIDWVQADLSAPGAIEDIVDQYQLDEVYHLAAISSPRYAETVPGETIDVNIGLVERLMRRLAVVQSSPRVFLASSASVFGGVGVSPQSEDTRFCPRDLYGVSKVCVLHIAEVWRQRGLFVSSGILYNHESRYRTVQFVTKKISDAVKRIKAGSKEKLMLGNLDAVRDWSYAGDFVRGFQASLSCTEPSDYVFASGSGRTVREYCEVAFSLEGLRWDQHVEVDPELHTASESVPLIGDPGKARAELGLSPTMTFEELVGEIGKEGGGYG